MIMVGYDNDNVNQSIFCISVIEKFLTHHTCPFCLPFTTSAHQSLPSKCLIHVVPTETSKLLPWQKEKWVVVQRAAEARKGSKNYQSSKYRAVVEALPSDPGDGDGYHSKCYKNFTAITTQSLPRPIGNDTVGPERGRCYALHHLLQLLVVKSLAEGCQLLVFSLIHVCFVTKGQKMPRRNKRAPRKIANQASSTKDYRDCAYPQASMFTCKSQWG